MGPPRWNMMRVPPCRSFSCSHDIDTISNVIKSPPPSARSWPPAIDAQALGPIEQARMKAEDNKRIQERMALQAIIAQMPAGPDSTSTEESMASKKSQVIGKMATKTPPQKPTPAAHKPMPSAKRSSPAPEQTGPPPRKQGQHLKHQDPAAAKHQPELAAAKAKSTMWIAQTQRVLLQQTPKHPAPVPSHPIQPAGYPASKSRMHTAALEPKEEETAPGQPKVHGATMGHHHLKNVC